MKRCMWISIFLICLNYGFTGYSADATGSKGAQIERVGGNFKVSKISKLEKGGFKVEFLAAEGAPKFKTLLFESDHINAGLTEGSQIRLSAEVLAISGSSAEISQVVVYLPSKTGPTPVWMMSKSTSKINPPAKLLEMHAPSTDYGIF
jgi:hypothetical protein